MTQKHRHHRVSRVLPMRPSQKLTTKWTQSVVVLRVVEGCVVEDILLQLEKELKQVSNDLAA